MEVFCSPFLIGRQIKFHLLLLSRSSVKIVPSVDDDKRGWSSSWSSALKSLSLLFVPYCAQLEFYYHIKQAWQKAVEPGMLSCRVLPDTIEFAWMFLLCGRTCKICGVKMSQFASICLLPKQFFMLKYYQQAAAWTVLSKHPRL